MGHDGFVWFIFSLLEGGACWALVLGGKWRTRVPLQQILGVLGAFLGLRKIGCTLNGGPRWKGGLILMLFCRHSPLTCNQRKRLMVKTMASAICSTKILKKMVATQPADCPHFDRLLPFDGFLGTLLPLSPLPEASETSGRELPKKVKTIWENLTKHCTLRMKLDD